MNYSDSQLVMRAKKHCINSTGKKGKLVNGAIAFVTESGKVRLNKADKGDKIKYTVKVEKNAINVYSPEGKKIVKKSSSVVPNASNAAVNSTDK